jgi:hypothetical protein
MPLAPGEKSKMVARLGVMRLGATRLGYYNPTLKFLIDGVDRSIATSTTGVFVDGLTITDELNHAPNTAQFKCRGFTPIEGQEVQIYMGDTDVHHQLFGGHILSLAQGFAGKPAAPNVHWDVTCIDYTWLLNRRTVIKKYGSQSATAIVLDLIATFAADFTTVNVTPGLPTIDEITFTNEDLPDALTRITERIGGYWYVDYAKDLHLFLTEVADAITVADGSKTASQVRRSADLSQVATRVVARGGGSNTAADVAVGQTTLPLVDAAATWYSASGGIVECGPQRINYTGVQLGGTGSTIGTFLAPPAAITTVDPGGGGGSMSTTQTYRYALGYRTAAGETGPGAETTASGLAVNGSMDVSGIPVPTDAKILGKTLYRNSLTGGALKVRHDMPLTDTTFNDFLGNAELGAAAPSTNTAFAEGIIAAGSTAVDVEDTAQFSATGGWAEGPGGQVFRYTGRSVGSGAGQLTGIPASGIGSLGAPLRGGTVRTIPHLTGVTGVLYAINKGEPVNLIAYVDDTAAQTAMAAYVGAGNGIHEYFITDGRWSITEALARATTELSQRKDPMATVSLTDRNPNIAAGRTITFTLTNPAITGSYKVQRVTISVDVPGGKVFPLRTVECSSRAYSIEDLLRQIRAR